MAPRILTDLKRLFRELCGALSMEEVTSNPPLIEAITRLERLFISLTVQ